MIYTYSLSTDKEAFYYITDKVRDAVEKSGVKNGVALIFCPHTTASITINENADEYVPQDILLGAREAFPIRPEFKHDEGNSACHIKCSVFGASETVIIEEGELVLGCWQDVYFAEFDPPRSRKIHIKVIEC